MFFKLAAKNVRRSIKDYLVYFLTLMLAVCVFYMFNSIDEQLVMLDLSASASSSASALVTTIGLLSLVISFVLAFLIIYANGFIMKRRKRELGLYMTLGLSNRNISGMLALETLLIGIIALAAGLAAGYFGSQGMSVLTAHVFQVDITNYHFIFSKDALLKTCAYFAVIFVAVMLLSVWSVSRQSLAQLLSAGKENQKVPTRSRWAAYLLTAAGVGVIALSYWMVLGTGFEAFLNVLLPAIGINFVGTLLFLLGLSGLMLSSHHKSARYFKGLRMFTERQLASRVTTNALSMSVICTMLFLTLVIVSSSATINSYMNAENDNIPFDASITTYTEDWSQNVPVEQAMEEVGIPLALFSNSMEFPVYESPITQGELCAYTPLYTETGWERIARQPIDALAVSDYNRLLELQGYDPIALADGTFAINCTLDQIRESLTDYLANPHPITIGTDELAYSGISTPDVMLWTSISNNTPLVLILPDSVAVQLAPPYLKVFVGDFSGDADVIGQMMEDKIDVVADYQTNSPTGTAMRMTLRRTLQFSNRLMDATMTFAGLYVGLIFLAAGAAVLALQVLTGASDDRPRYRLLQELGADQKMMRQAVFSQVAVYFLIPLVIAAVHSVFGISYMVGMMGVLGFENITSGAVTMALLICAVYGVYFVVTYSMCRSMLNSKEERRTE